MLPPTRPLLLLLLLASSVLAASRGGRVEFHRGRMAFDGGNFHQAGKDFSLAGRAGYPRAKVHYWLARCYLQLGEEARALDQLKRARKAGRDSDEITFEVARISLGQGDFEIARGELAKLPEEWTRQPRVQALVAHLAVTDARWEDAVKALHQAIDHFPGYCGELVQVMPEEHRLALDTLVETAQQRVEAAPSRSLRAIPEAPARSSAPVPPASATQPLAPEPALEPRVDNTPGAKIRGISRFGSKHAFQAKKKSRDSRPQILNRWGTGRKPAASQGGGGPFTLSRPTYSPAQATVGQ